MRKSTEVDAYIAGFQEPVRSLLEEIRALIASEAPDAIEKMSYAMPTFDLGGNLVHFAGYGGHIGLYPTPSGITEFEGELAPYAHAKGSVRFPLDTPLPADLIRKIVRFRVAENLSKAKGKK